ncbi:MAG: DEAD/DEAH box helicase [Endomicrobium sp.]|uniref:ATP-dependent DNA helicase n=1 Tax=Candidatus Endomicrobiellum pyrsonymphae TaxID=1408203 RepID=UPI00358089EB|nr:DEAD/DEAH box helicase [Endomicrobium sp.]
MNNKIEINNEFKEAYDLIDKGSDCVFVTGNAGTGKTTFLRYYMTRAKKKTIVLAPTGVAALNCGGETIHSFFNFKPDITLSKIKKKKLSEKSIYKKVETIVIDEASMLRCDILDCIDKFLRLNREKHKDPFGGIQLVFIGDLKQLPPVVKREELHIFNSVYKSPYFLSAYSLNECMLHTVELKKIYRQQDVNFVALLNAVRNGAVGESELIVLNRKVSSHILDKPMAVYLTTTNKKAAFINHQYLSKIKAEQAIFSAEIENMDENSKAFPAEPELVIKKGAQVMMVNNDGKGRWVNGSIGIVDDIKSGSYSDKVLIHVKFSNGRTEYVEPYKWELFKYKWNETEGQIETESAGFFKQYPLKLSWAVTIHKSQGKTFDNVIIDMEYGAFAPGQLYVALSRCTSFDGITLSRPLTKRDILAAKLQ